MPDKKIDAAALELSQTASLFACLLFSIVVFFAQPSSAKAQSDEASLLNGETVKLFQQQRYTEAEHLAQKALTLREQILGSEHPLTALSMYNLGMVYLKLHQLDKSEPLLLHSLTIREKFFGPEHKDTMASADALVGAYFQHGKYVEAIPLIQRLLTNSENVNGANHRTTATFLHILGLAEIKHQELGKAEQSLLRALAIRNSVIGSEHNDTKATAVLLVQIADNLRLQGEHVHLKGDYAQSSVILEHALTIYEQVLGDGDKRTLICRHWLGLSLGQAGDFAKAFAVFEKALLISTNTFGSESSDAITSLQDLAWLSFWMRDYAKSKEYYFKAQTALDKTAGETSLQALRNIVRYARTLVEIDELDAAKQLLVKALPAIERAGAAMRFQLAELQGLRARIASQQGRHEEAVQLCLQMVAEQEKLLGRSHPFLTNFYMTLGEVYERKSDVFNAQEAYAHSLQIAEQSFGHQHPLTALAMTCLARTKAVLGQSKAALELYSQAHIVAMPFIDNLVSFASEGQKLFFLKTIETEMGDYASLVADNFRDDPKTVAAAFDAVLHRKGIVIESQKDMYDVLLDADSPEAKSLLQQLRDTRFRLSALASSPTASDGPDGKRLAMAELEKKKGELQLSLSRLSQEFSRKIHRRKASTAKLAAALPVDSALVEIVRIQGHGKAGKKASSIDGGRYIAFVLHPGKSGGIRLITIGDAQRIDARIAGLKQRIMEEDNTATERESRALYDMVFQPLREAIGPVKRLYYSPDGVLNLLPLEVLTNPEGHYVVEEFTVVYLGAGRDLLALGGATRSLSKPLLLGDPDFDLSRAVTTPKVASIGQAKELFGRNSPLLRSAEMGSMRFDRLPQTRVEVQAIAEVLGRESCEIYTGKDALEETLTSRPSPKLLHIATHGFFVSPHGGVPEGLNAFALSPSSRSSTSDQAQGSAIVENPLLRSGIVLAGANTSLTSGSTASSVGVFTAEKIMNLDLRGTDLVVLSACNTGIGEVENGQGVYGLQYAFNHAGAKSIIMSMWSVPDLETRELMVAFYFNIAAGQDRAQALRNAMLKELGVVKKRHNTSNPIYWGAFVLMGDPGHGSR